MENRFGAPASGTPEGSARREFELLLLLGGSRKAAVQLWLRKQRIYANAQQAAGRPATEAKGSRGAAERQAGGESKPETAAQAARRHRSERRLREKHLARKIWAAVRVRKHLSRWCERARAAVAKRPAPSSTTSTAAAAPPPAPPRRAEHCTQLSLHSHHTHDPFETIDQRSHKENMRYYDFPKEERIKWFSKTNLDEAKYWLKKAVHGECEHTRSWGKRT